MRLLLGPLLRKTLYPSYHTFNNTSNTYLGLYNVTHIVDKPDSVQLEDNSNTIQGGVGYGYDSVVGNMLSATKWLNASGTAGLTYQYQYDSFGNMTHITDPQGNTTQYVYADSFVDSCQVTSPSYAYLTQIKLPQVTSGVQPTLNFSYHCASGLLASSTDENANTTAYTYNDPLNRLTGINYPSGWGSSTIAYVDSGTSSIEKKRLDQSGTVWSDSYSFYDGTHRLVSSSVANAESLSWDRTDTCYDGLSRVRFKSYPYQTASTPSANNSCYSPRPGDTYSYDALGRTTSVTHSDSSAITTTYTGRAIDVKDEGNGTRPVERISQSDALGRLSYVCEVTGQSQNSVSPGNCGLDYSGTGFLTQYQYTPRGDLSNIYQGLETRTFTYDLTSRLLQSQNPENGLVTYNYDSDGNCTAQATYLGELVSKVDTRNVRTCFQYDQLHRVIGKTYSGGSATAPPVTYAYDQTTAFGVGLTNTIGRLSSESTGGSYPTASVFGYDTMGHVINNSQCTPANCGTSVYPITYPSYNVLGEPTSSTDGVGNSMSYAYNAAGRLTALTSSLNDANHPASLLSNVHYNAFGEPVTSSIGAVPLSDIRAYDLRGRLGTKWVGNTQGTTDATGTFTISGSEQGSGSPTHSTGSFMVVGGENSMDSCDDAGDCTTLYDNGVVAIQIGSTWYSTSYGPGDTPQSLASALASQMNNSQLSATYSGATVYLTSAGTGSATDYTMTDGSQTYDNPPFDGTSFSASPSGLGMTGGYTQSGPFDSGTVSVTVGGVTSTVNYGQNDTTSTVASKLAAAISADDSLVSATASGSTISLTTTMPGSLSDYSLSATSASTAGFSPSFTATPSSSSMVNGTGATVYSVGLDYMPNGDVSWSNDSANGFWLYSYDDFNRLQTAVSNTGYGCSETYDLYGNRYAQTPISGGSCLSPSLTPNLNNQFNQYGYEAASYTPYSGNIQSDGFHTYAWDADNRISTVDGGSTASYVYDAEGRRVRKMTSSGWVDFLYDLSGHVMSEISSTSGWDRGEVYAMDEHVATYENGTTYFTHADWIGTERARSSVNGSVYSTWTSLPFGEGSASANPGPTHFTGKERDAESGLDNFGARYYESGMGRFMSPDWSASAEPVPYAKLIDPQTFNLYVYTRNNPVTGVDRDGHFSSLDGIPADQLPAGLAGTDVTNYNGSNEEQNAEVKAEQNAEAQQQSSSTTTVTLNNRQANIPGGGALDAIGIDHQWITFDGVSVGMGTAQGVPQSDAPGVQTQVVDHTGQVATSTQTFTGVDSAALSTYTKVGTPTGRWIPGVNDCNTWAYNVIHQSTPHDIYDRAPVVTKNGVIPGHVEYHNVVVYADGSIHSPGGQ